jgi:F0F1-type ATP synthase assembly protein I
VKDISSGALLAELGWVLALWVLLPLGIGIWADRTFHLSPLFFLVGALVGILAGTVGAVRIATRAIAQAEGTNKSEIGGTGQKEDMA